MGMGFWAVKGSKTNCSEGDFVDDKVPMAGHRALLILVAAVSSFVPRCGLGGKSKVGKCTTLIYL